MCMGCQLTELSQKRIINKAKKKGYIRVWKTVLMPTNYSLARRYRKRKSFFAWWTYRPYEKGIQRAYGTSRRNGGWHAFRNKKSAENHDWGNDAIIECLALPKWIKNIGRDGSLKTILFTKLCFPEFPKRKVTIKEFKQYLKS